MGEPVAPPEEDVVFGNTVEALFVRALGSRMTERCHERLAAEGIDPRGKLKPYYPRLTYYQCVRIVASELFPESTEPQALFELGKLFMAGFEETLIGRAMLTAVRVMGPKRTLTKMSQNFRSSNNYMQCDLNLISPGNAELSLSQTSGAPEYFQGVLHSGLKMAGAKGLDITLKESDGTKAVLALRWS